MSAGTIVIDPSIPSMYSLSADTVELGKYVVAGGDVPSGVILNGDPVMAAPTAPDASYILTFTV
jgi:hypothetical protein